MLKYFKYIYIPFLLTMLVNPCFGQDEDVPEKEIDVILGIDRIEKLSFTPDTQIQIGNQSILRIDPIPQQQELTFKGLAAGKTSVTVRDTVGDRRIVYLVNIVENDQSRVIQDLKEFLGDIEGLEIGIKGDSVYVGGDIVVPEDIGKVVVVLEKYPDVVRLIELSPVTQQIIARRMQEEIQNNNLKNVTVRVVNKSFWLEGVATSDAERQRAQDIAEAYLPDNIESLARRVDAVSQVERKLIVNFISVDAKSSPPPVPKLIKISAQFVELTKDYAKVFGFRWNPVLGGDGGSIQVGKRAGGGVSTSSQGTLAGTISNLFPRLSSAKSAGHARVVQSGVVVTQDNVEATINKTTTSRFGLGSNEFTQGEESTAGFQLTVRPQILPEENIDLGVDLSVSSNTGSPPETQSNSVRTSLVVKSSESAVVGGIVVDNSNTDYDKDPPGGNQTIEEGQELFSFLRSKSYQSNKSQFVIFITPELVDSATEGTDEIKRKFRRRRR
jgi:pilus assembly protein CpaC